MNDEKKTIELWEIEEDDGYMRPRSSIYVSCAPDFLVRIVCPLVFILIDPHEKKMIFTW